MTELELTRAPKDRRLYLLEGFGTVRLEGWFGRTGSAAAEVGRSWRFSRRGLFGRVIEARDVAANIVGEFTPRDIRRGGKLRWGARELRLQPVGLRERYVLGEDGRDLALLDARGWGKRPVKITLAVQPAAIDAGLLLFSAFVAHQMAGDSSTAASTGSTAAMSGSFGG